MDAIFKCLKGLTLTPTPSPKGRGEPVPLVAMVSYTLVHHRGLERFVVDAKEAGFAGAIVIDDKEAGPTASAIEELIPPAATVMLAEPSASAVTSPVAFTFTTDAALLDHVAAAVKSLLVPSL